MQFSQQTQSHSSTHLIKRKFSYRSGKRYYSNKMHQPQKQRTVPLDVTASLVDIAGSLLVIDNLLDVNQASSTFYHLHVISLLSSQILQLKKKH
jgi:hypothetical protein